MSRFDDKVTRTVEQLRLGALDGYSSRRPIAVLATPRRAFELLFFEQMQLDPRDLEVVAESADRIVWESRNRCPLQEACATAGLDTRTVCRRVNERATQAFCSRLDPQLRFHRSYTEIRPHADVCR